MKIKNILVYPCSSGVGQEIYFSLVNHKDVKVYGANSDSITPGYFLYKENYIGNAPPMKKEKECIEWLQGIIQDKHIDVVFPAYDDAQVWLKQREEVLGAKIITSSLETVQICRSKKLTYKHLQAYIRCPILYETEPTEYPVFIKPECGEGSKGCYKIDSKEELDRHFTKDHICIEYLPGEEYTVDCFTDKERNLQFVGARERVLTRAGISILTKGIETTEEIQRMAERINEHMEMQGAWFFQIKKSKDGTMCLMEIAPRIPGAMAYHREQGINFPLLSVYTHMGEKVNCIQPKIQQGYCCKMYSNYFYFPNNSNEIKALYVDLDDTLIVREKEINPSIVGLIYLARNRGKKVYLVSRHKNDIYETLKRVKIASELFDEIYHLDARTPKSSVMTERPAIFIDDSFRERYEVTKKYEDVYCYDVDCVGAIEGHLRTTPA